MAISVSNAMATNFMFLFFLRFMGSRTDGFGWNVRAFLDLTANVGLNNSSLRRTVVTLNGFTGRLLSRKHRAGSSEDAL